MIATSFDAPFAVYSFLPSALIAMPRGNAPTPSIVATTAFFAGSTISTDVPAPVVTYSCLPSGEKTPDCNAGVGRRSASAGSDSSCLNVFSLRVDDRDDRHALVDHERRCFRWARTGWSAVATPASMRIRRFSVFGSSADISSVPCAAT